MTIRTVNPQAERRSGYKSLDIDFGEQRELAYNIKRLDRDLSESPMAIPNLVEIALRGVNLRQSPQGKFKSNLSLDIVEQQQGSPSASVTVTDGVTRESAMYNLLPTFNMWEEWHPGNSAPDNTITNSDFINLLEPQLPKEHVFDQLMDKIPTGLEVAHMLAYKLRPSAKTRAHKRRYATTKVVNDEKEYAGGVETTFTTQEVNGRTRRNLFIAASQFTNFGVIEKLYGYQTLFSQRALIEAGGTVSFSTTDRISKHRLDAFAQRDQHRNYPVDSLNQGLKRLREAYEI